MVPVKPVMEGKAVLFEKFAGIDVFNIEIAETHPDRLVEIIANVRGLLSMTAIAGYDARDVRCSTDLSGELRVSA